MKLEIEITDDEIRSAVERKVRVAVADQTNQWSSDQYIKEQVKARWLAIVGEMIDEAIADSNAIKAKIAAELERKLRAQLAAALRSQPAA